jgi:glutathione peroxidase
MQISMQSLQQSLKPSIRNLNRHSLVLLAASFLCLLPAFAEKPPAKQQTVYDFSLVDQDGKVVPLSDYKGKLLLIVNLASQSVYSNQMAALNELEKTYSAKGLQVIGIPSPEFGGEELKDPAAMRKYYSDTLHADFPVFASATLNGVNAIPLYQFLCDPKQSVPGGDIRWSYTKFLIGRDGKPLARYEVDIDPADIDFHVAIESALAGKLKKPSSGEKTSKGGGRGDSDE